MRMIDLDIEKYTAFEEQATFELQQAHPDDEPRAMEERKLVRLVLMAMQDLKKHYDENEE